MPREPGNSAGAQRRGGGPWVAVVNFRGQEQVFGSFKTEAEAMKAAIDRLELLERNGRR